MNFLLIIVTSTVFFQPKSYVTTTFQTEAACRQALFEFNKNWATIRSESKCVDLEKEHEIRLQESKLKSLKESR